VCFSFQLQVKIVGGGNIMKVGGLLNDAELCIFMMSHVSLQVNDFLIWLLPFHAFGIFCSL
jgi:hypothetical protein